jgi:hypothetical protein
MYPSRNERPEDSKVSTKILDFLPVQKAKWLRLVGCSPRTAKLNISFSGSPRKSLATKMLHLNVSTRVRDRIRPIGSHPAVERSFPLEF